MSCRSKTALYLHLLPDSVYAFDFIKKINQLYISNEHLFFVNFWAGKRNYPKNVVVCKYMTWKTLIKFIICGHRSSKIILHSLYVDKKTYVFLTLLSIFKRRKLYWFIWSDDLYADYRKAHQSSNITFSRHVKERLRELIIKNLGGVIVTGIGDFEQLKKWYKTNAKMIQAEYTYTFFQENKTLEKKELNKILVGHSAAEMGNHEEILYLLKSCICKDAEIICPLSYPIENREYAKNVSNIGTQLFGLQFKALDTWMDYDKYIALLSSIDIAVFGGKQQMAAGNIVNLLRLGKKLYIAKENSLLEKFQKDGIICFSIEDITKDSFLIPLTDSEKLNNKTIIEDIYSDKTFMKKWNTVFYS